MMFDGIIWAVADDVERLFRERNATAAEVAATPRNELAYYKI